MRPGGGKCKGSAFERDVAKKLSLWITTGCSDKELWRTHSSGGVGTVSKISQECGDIMGIGDIGRSFCSRYNIECRIGKVIKFSDLIYRNEKSSMYKFIFEGRENAKRSNRIPIWIFKEHCSRDIVVAFDLQCDYSKGLSIDFRSMYPIIFKKLSVYFILFEELINNCKFIL